MDDAPCDRPEKEGRILPLDIILLWLGLASGVLLLVWGGGGLWAVKGLVLIAGGAAMVAVDPLHAGWVEGGALACLFVIPALLAGLANRVLLPQRYGAAGLLYRAVYVLHPDANQLAQVRLIRGLALAAGGGFDAAIARFDAVAGDPRTPPTMALMARFQKRRLEDRLDLLIGEVAWERAASPLATMVRLGALASLQRPAELVAVQAAEGARLQTRAARRSRAWEFGLVSLFVGTGRVAALERLFAGGLRRMPGDVRAFHLAVAQLAAGVDVAGARVALSRLAGAADRDVGLRARRALAEPPAAVVLQPGDAAVVQAAEADLDAGLAGVRRRPRLFGSPVTLVLIAVNLAAFAVELASGGSENEAVLRRLGALRPDLVIAQGQWWRVPAATILHFGWLHLGINMLALVAVGRLAERALGWGRMLATYLAAGLGSMAGIVLLVCAGWVADDSVVGASGAIMGLFGALVVDAARAWRRTGGPAARSRFVALLLLVALQAGLDAVTPQVSAAGHALGFIVGVLVALAVGRGPAGATEVPGVPPPQAAAPRLTRRQAAALVVGAGFAGFAGAVFPSRRDQAEARLVHKAANRTPPALLAAVRRLRFIFVDNVESGAPMIDPMRPFGSLDPLADLAAATGVAGGAALLRLFVQVMTWLPEFCGIARLEPGRYVVDGAQVSVSVEQIRLVAALSWRVPDFDAEGIAPRRGAWPVPYVDFKRPYGDMTYFEADMAEALDLPVGRDAEGRADLADDVLARLDALHDSMATVLRAFVVHAVWPGPR